MRDSVSTALTCVRGWKPIDRGERRRTRARRRARYEERPQPLLARRIVPNVAPERLVERVDLRARDLDLRLADLREVARAAREDARRQQADEDHDGKAARHVLPNHHRHDIANRLSALSTYGPRFLRSIPPGARVTLQG